MLYKIRLLVLIATIVCSTFIAFNAQGFHFTTSVGRDWQVENAFYSGAIRGVSFNLLPNKKFGEGLEETHPSDVFVVTPSEYRLSVEHGRFAHLFGIFIGNFLFIFLLLGILPSSFLMFKP